MNLKRGTPTMSVNARKETIIHAILKIQKSRKPLDRKTVAAWNPRLVWAACDYFGNWGNAITAAGLVYKDIRLHSRGEKRTKENIIQAIQDRSRQSQSITSWIVQKEDQPLYGAARRYFGSWGDAVNASGFCYDEIALQIPFRWNKNIILKKIKKRIRGKKSLQGNAVCREQLDLYNAARRYFGKGGWRKALSLCG
ncbi:hypothetical protein HYT52_00030, partial [Candidatus Woesearchaeota archaeon]|nr:hypothetical protein [Candidatus Woesearchaeota archaeon]